MQSCILGSNSSVSPQRNQKNKIFKYDAVVGGAGISRLVEENILSQILDSEPYIFMVSSTLERIYRKRYIPGANEVIESIAFKRVRKGDSAFEQLRYKGIARKRRHGNVTPFEGVEYHVYILVSEGDLKGCMLSYKDALTQEIKKLYFVREN